MIPVDQTVFDDGYGNCLSACVASILELPIADVPNFRESPEPESALRTWLAQRGWSVFQYTVATADDLASTHFNTGPGVYVILGGAGPRTNAQGRPKQHAVVGRAAGYGVKIVHDPHPSRLGLVGDEHRFVWVLARGTFPDAAPG